MHHFEYKNGVLHAEDIPIPDICEAVGTPFYCYSTATLKRHYQVFRAPLPDRTLVCYSVKANSNLSVITTLAEEGAGADVVSAGELRRALRAGIPSEKIVFSGVGKTETEMRAALAENIHQFNVESDDELEVLARVAAEMGRKAPVALRINPDVDAKTHQKISTGRAENKFGIPWRKAREVYDRAAGLDGVEIVGIDVHIGSQITELEPFEEAFTQVASLVKELRANGHAIERVDLGGGLGIPYTDGNKMPPHPDEYGAMINRVVGDLNAEVIFEPGRLIVGNAGILVTTVIYAKEGDGRDFLILDAAMNDLVRPALYDAHHDIIPIAQPEDGTRRRKYDIVGPVCESGDTFARDRVMPEASAGDQVAILSAGAYGAVQASTYNTRALIPEVLVSGDLFSEIRPRQTIDALLELDEMAPWLNVAKTKN
jgi:diaminopimelate decarboxylase